MVQKLDRSYFTAKVNAAPQTGGVKKLDRSYFDRQNTAPTETNQPPQTTAAPSAAAATSSGKLDLPSFGERVGKTLIGAAKQYASGAANAAGLSSAGQRGTAMSGVYEEQAQALDEQIASLEASLANGALTHRQRKDTLDTIELVKQQRDNYRGAVRSGEQTAGEVYKAADDLARSGTEDIERAKEGLGSVGKTAIDVGVAGSQMLGDAALGGLTGSALAPMFLRSMGGSAQEARQAGASREQQLAYGLASGALSVATEKLSNIAKPFKAAFGGGVFDRALESALAKMNGSAAGKLALSFLSEGGEEVVEDLVQPVLQSIYNGQSVAQNYDELTLSDVLYDGLIGGILGGLGGGVELLGDAAQRRGQQTQQPPTQQAPLPAPQTAQERADALGDETTLPTAENAPTAQETDALGVLRGLSRDVSQETAQRAPRDRLQTFEDVLGESGKRAMRTAYQDGMDVDEFSGEFLRAYHAGETGNENPNTTSGISYLAHEAGKNDAAASLAEEKRAAQFAAVAGEDSGLVYDDYVSREMDSATADEINSVAKALGVRVRMVDAVRGGTANAQYQGSDILVEKNNPNPVMFLVGHEMTHRMQELAPEQYRAFRDSVTSLPEVQAAAETLLEIYREGGEDIGYEDALDEATANFAGEMIANTDVLNDFIRQHSGDRTLLEKLRDALHELVQKLTGRAKKQAQTAEGKLTAALEAASKQAASLQGKADGATMDAVKLSLKDMSEGERAALLQYKSSESYKINAKLRDGTALTPAERKMVADLDAALEKLPVHEGTVYRRLSFDMEGQEALDAFLAEHAEGDVVPYEAYTSSSTAIDGYPVSGELTATLVIDSKTGRDMAGIGNNNESEILFARNTRFIIEQVTQDAQGNPVIYMKEDTENGIGQLHPEKRVQAVQQVREKSEVHINLHKVSETDTARGTGERNLPGVRGEKGNEKVKFSLKTDSKEIEREINSAGLYLQSKDNNKNNIRIRNYFREKYPDYTVVYQNDKHTGQVKVLEVIQKSDAEAAALQRMENAKTNAEAVAAQRRFYGNIKTPSGMETLRETIQNRLEKDGFENVSVEPSKSTVHSISTYIHANSKAGYPVTIKISDHNTVGQRLGYMTDAFIDLTEMRSKNEVYAKLRQALEENGVVPTSDPDIRHSLKGTENAQELAALRRENEKLRERVEYWKGQTRRSNGVTTDKAAVNKAAKALARDYGARVEAEEIAGELQSLYDYIARGGDESGELTYTEARRRADGIAEQIAESAIVRDDELYNEYADLRKRLKDTKLTLTKEDAAGINDFKDLKSSVRKVLRIATGERTNVDQVYSELSELHPEFFNEQSEMNVADQVERMAEVAARLNTINEYNPFEGYMGQAVASISNDIMERFFDLPQTAKTFADRQAAKLEEAKAKGRQQVQEAELAGQMAQGRRDAKELRRAREALRKESARREEMLRRMRERYAERDAAKRESQNKRELRAKIVRHASKLSQKLLRPSDKQHIPEEMRSAVAAVLNSINTESRYTTDADGKHVYDDTGTPTRRTEVFRALREQYEKILSTGEDIVVDPALFNQEGIEGGFEEVIKMGDKRLSELTTDELKTLWRVLRSVEHSVSTAGKMLSVGKYETTKAFAEAFKNDVSTRRPKMGGKLELSLENPYTFFAHYGQAGKDIYRMLRNAQDAQEIMSRDVTEKVRRILGEKAKPTNGRERAGALRGNDVWQYSAHTNSFTTEGGEAVTLTDAQAMELYLLSKRKQARDHLLGSGIYQPEVKDAATGKTKTRRGTQAIKLTQNDLDRIAEMLTPEMKRVADDLQALTTDTLARYGNEASMRAYGYRKFTEKDYWPIRSAQEELHSTQEKSGENVRSIKNIGMAQQVKPKASNAVEVGSVFDTFARHASDMIDYAAWLNPMEDAKRLYNFRYRNANDLPTGVTLKGLLDEKGGQGAQRYWGKLMGDIQNGIGTRDYEPMSDYFSKFTGRFKGAAVGANIRVVIQQPTAFFRAGAVLSPADMAKGARGGVTRGDGWKKATKYSPIAMRKDTGGFDISSPYTLNDRFYGKQGAANKLNEVAGAAAGAADAVTWGKLWNACEWQVKRERPNLEAGSEAFYAAVNDVFTDMIDQTQVVDGVLQRSNIARGKPNSLPQQATTFAGEPLMSINMVLRAYDRYRYEQKPDARNEARRALARTTAALVVTSTVNALAQSVVDGLRDDDRDKDYWEKLLSAFTGIEGDEETGLEKAISVVLNGNLAGNLNLPAQVPYFRDIFSIIQGYDVARPDMETFSGLVNASETFINSAGGKGKKTRKEALLDLFSQSAKMLGVPVANLKRDIMAGLRTMAAASGNIPLQYELEKFTYNIGSEQNRSRYIGLLYDALEQGDFASYEHIRSELIGKMGLNGETINSSLKTLYKKKLDKDEDYSLSQKALDKLGIRGKYADEEEADSFGADDLDAAAYTKYENSRADTYRQMEDHITQGNLFASFSDETKDKALNYAAQYAEKTALRDASGGAYEVTTKWILTAEELKKKYSIPPATFVSLKAATSECKSLKDKDGDSITYSKGLQVMEIIYQQKGLSDKQRAALFEAFNVPESIRHYNKALVSEKLKAMRKQAK